MSKRVTRSLKGEEVDFDLLETKQKMEENKPRTLEVKQREDFVHTRRRSRGRRAIMDRLKKNSVETKSAPVPTSKGETSSKKSEAKSTSKAPSKGKRKIVKDDKG